MKKFWHFFRQELALKPINSAVQMLFGGLLGYGFAFVIGPSYGCGAGNHNAINGAMSCTVGSLPVEMKALILLCIVLASLCMGRAVSLSQQHFANQK